MSQRRGRLKTQVRPRFTRLPDRARRTGQAILLFAAFVLFINGIVGENGLIESRRARAQRRELLDSVTRLRTENRRLRDDARRLRDDPAAIEEVARQDLGLIAPGEQVFYLNDAPLREPPAR